MASIWSTYMQDLINNWTYHATAMPAPPAVVYVALFSTDPGQTGNGTELSGNGYSRQAVVSGASSGGTISNSSDLVWSQATADWPTALYAATFDAPSGGNMLNHIKLPAPLVTRKGQVARIPQGALSLTP